MNLFSPVSTIMSTQLLTLSPSASIAEAAILFDNNNIHHIPITRNRELVGIVSKTDYLFFRRGFPEHTKDHKLEEIRMNNFDVSYIMTTGIGKVDADDKIVLALELFKKNYFHALPVMKDGVLAGIITTHDIIRNLANDVEATAQ